MLKLPDNTLEDISVSQAYRAYERLVQLRNILEKKENINIVVNKFYL